jgi:hypothetical protein
MSRRDLASLLILLVLIILSGHLVSCSSAKVSISAYYPDYVLVKLRDLNKDVQEYFAQRYPKSDPGCIKEDFDGDGVFDYALLLRKNMGEEPVEKLVVLKGINKKEFMAIEISTFHERIGDIFLRRVQAGRIEGLDRTESTTLDRPGFEIVLFEAASRIYFWKNGNFVFIQTSD